MHAFSDGQQEIDESPGLRPIVVPANRKVATVYNRKVFLKFANISHIEAFGPPGWAHFRLGSMPNSCTLVDAAAPLNVPNFWSNAVFVQCFKT